LSQRRFQFINRKKAGKPGDLGHFSPGWLRSSPVQAGPGNVLAMKASNAMRRFFIHLDVDGIFQRDQIGLLCEAPELVYLHACRAIPDLAAAMLRARQNPMLCRFLIENEKGEEMFDVPFSEVIREKAHL
jgi:hypothetical protein